MKNSAQEYFVFFYMLLKICASSLDLCLWNVKIKLKINKKQQNDTESCERNAQFILLPEYFSLCCTGKIKSGIKLGR